MIKYNFDEEINRRHTHSYKWDIKERHMDTEDVLGMWTADMDFKSPQPMLDILRDRLDHGILGYTIRGENFYEIIKNWMKHRFNWTLTDEDIHFCPPGVIPAACMLVDLLTEPGEEVFAFMPNYDSLYGTVEAMGRKLVTAPLLCAATPAATCGDWTLNLDAFEKIVRDRKIHLALFCSPHNPVGRVWTLDELLKFGEICRKYNVFIISDEVHCDIIRPDTIHTPMGKVPGMEDLSATLMSPNKSFNVAGVMTASVIIHNREVMKKFRTKLNHWAMNLDTVFGTLAVESLYSDPECEYWLNQVNEYLTENLESAVDHIKKNIPCLSTYVPQGTYLLWIDFSKTPLRGHELRRYLVQECKLDLCDGWEFDPECLDHMRLNCACTKATLKEALKRLEKCKELL